MEVCPCDIHDILEQSIKHNDAISAEGYAKYIASIRPTARLRLLEKWWEEAQIKNDKLGELNADILGEMKYQIVCQIRMARNAALEEAANACMEHDEYCCCSEDCVKEIRSLKEE